MPTTIGGSVVWNLDVDNKKFKSGMNDASKTAEKTAKDIDSNISRGTASASRSFSKLAVAAKASFVAIGVAAAAGAAAVIKMGVSTSAQLESARQGFVALLGSAEKADATMARIKKEAAATPFELPGLVQGAQALTAITKDGDKAVDTLLDVGKAIATSGKGQEELNRVIFNLQQISATGTVTAMDIRQFQSAIPMFNDIVGVLGMTTQELKESDNAAELLFEAFRKAGEEGGITAAGFSAQAGTFNQQMSNLKDNFAILSSEIVNQTGLFDGFKMALGELNTALGDHETIISNIQMILEVFRNAWNQIMEALTIHVKPAFDELMAVLEDELGPELRRLWELLEPLLTPALKTLAVVAGTIMITALKFLIEILTFVTKAVSNLLWAFNNLLEFFKGFEPAIRSAFAGVEDAIVSPFRKAREKVGQIMQDIKDKLQNINPFHRESPSLVDNVKAGVGIIKSEYASLKDITLPSVAAASSPFAVDQPLAFAATSGISPNNQNISNRDVTVNIGQVNDNRDLDLINREIGYKIAVLPQ